MGLIHARRIGASDGPGTEPLLPVAGVARDPELPPAPGGAELAPDTNVAVALGGVGMAGQARVPQAAGLEVPRDALGRLVLGLLHTMLPGRLDDLQTPRVAGLVRQLRQRVTLALCCTMLTAPVAVWLLARGVSTYADSGRPACGGPLRIWLLGFLMLQLAWPICMPSLTLLLLGWCLGALVLLPKPKHCVEIHEFLFEAAVLQTMQAALLLVAAAAALTARPLVQRLGDLLSHSGTDQEVIGHIAVLPAGELTQDAECVICLSRDDEDGVPWRQLACGHHFHEPCLLEWLGKARRCPVCRLDLHVAYAQALGGEESFFDA